MPRMGTGNRVNDAIGSMNRKSLIYQDQSVPCDQIQNGGRSAGCRLQCCCNCNKSAECWCNTTRFEVGNSACAPVEAIPAGFLGDTVACDGPADPTRVDSDNLCKG